MDSKRKRTIKEAGEGSSTSIANFFKLNQQTVNDAMDAMR